MTGTSLVAVLLMVGIVMLVMSYWRQIAVLILSIVITVFCFGVYWIINIIASIT
jgi:hypothetical protein